MIVKNGIKALKNIVTILLFAVLFILLFVVVSMKASGGEAGLFGYQIKSVLSGSMEPGIQTGSIIAVKETDTTHHFEKGDVITFLTDEGMVVTHRIEQVKDDGQTYITKGDANDGADLDPVMQENIIGKYSGVTVPYVGYAMSFLNSSKGAALLMVLPGIGLVIYSIIQIRQAIRTLGRSQNKLEAN